MSRILRWTVVALALLATSCGNGVGTGDSVPDGQWELVRLDYDGRSYDEPLILSSNDQLFGGRGACNSFGQQPNGDIVQTAAGCGDERERIDEALIDAVRGRRQIDENTLILNGSFATAVLRSIVLPTPEELFSILATDAPDVDPATVLFDEEAGGPPTDWDRMIRIESNVELAQFFIGANGQSVCLHIGLETERVTGGSTCRQVQDVRSEAISMVVGYPEPSVRAALIPDAFLTEANIALLEPFGALYENLYVVDPSQAVQLTLDDSDGNAYNLNLREVAE